MGWPIGCSHTCSLVCLLARLLACWSVCLIAFACWIVYLFAWSLVSGRWPLSCGSAVCLSACGLALRHFCFVCWFVFWSSLRERLSASLGLSFSCPRSCLPACFPSGLGCCVRLFGLVFLFSPVLFRSLFPSWLSLPWACLQNVMCDLCNCLGSTVV